MAETATPSLEDILRYCAAAAPEPWYPSIHARTAGIARDSLDLPLQQLRLAGLVALTPWVPDKNQGYVLTPEGKEALENPRTLTQIRIGALSRRPIARPEPPAEPVPQDRERPVEGRPEPPRPVVTYALIWVNILVFAYGLYLATRLDLPAEAYLTAGPTKDASNPLARQQAVALTTVLQESGAIRGDLILDGQWWRLLTCCFVHFGVLHLGMNMLSLYWVGPTLEYMWGWWRYLLIYLISGFAGSCAMVLATPTILGAGASGALWGIMISLGAWIILNRQRMPEGAAAAALRRLVMVIILNVFISMAPGISAAAHFGGGAAGAIVSIPMDAERRSRGLRRWLARLGVLAVPALCVLALVWYQRIDPWWQMQRTTHKQHAEIERTRPQREEAEKAREENLAFYETCEPQIDAATDGARKVFRELVASLLAQPPAERPAATAEAAIAVIAQQRAALTQLLKTLPQPDRFTDPGLQATLQLGRELVAAMDKQLQLAADALAPSEDAADKKSALDKQSAVVADLRQRWRNAKR